MSEPAHERKKVVRIKSLNIDIDGCISELIDTLIKYNKECIKNGWEDIHLGAEYEGLHIYGYSTETNEEYNKRLADELELKQNTEKREIKLLKELLQKYPNIERK